MSIWYQTVNIRHYQGYNNWTRANRKLLIKHLWFLLYSVHIVQISSRSINYRPESNRFITKFSKDDTIKAAPKAIYENWTFNSMISSSWPNQTFSLVLSYWMIVCGYEIKPNSRTVSLSALASFQNTTPRNCTIATNVLFKNRHQDIYSTNFFLIKTVQ